jgi:hypothetical protein
VPSEYLVGQRRWRSNVVDAETGEIIAEGQRRAHRRRCSRSCVTRASATIQVLYTDELESRRLHSADAAHRRDRTTQLAGAGRDLPHDAPGRAADAKTRREALFHSLFFNAGTLRPVRASAA